MLVRKFNKIDNVIYSALPENKFQFSDEAENYDLALVRSADLLEAKFPANCIAIARAGAGVNNIPLERCAEEGICVFNTPGANANAVKELVILGLLLCGRDAVGGMAWLAEQKAAGQSGVDKTMEKAKSNYVGHEIMGKTLGIVGLGAIGRLVKQAAEGLGMQVIGYDPMVETGYSLDDIFKKSDFITLHVPQNAETKGMINKDAIAKMKDGVSVLNFARGGLICDDDVLTALQSGKLHRYVTDFPNDNLNGQAGVIAFPHLGASTPEAEENCARMAAEQLAIYLETGNIVNSVNLPNCNVEKKGPRTTVIAKKGTKLPGNVFERGNFAYAIIDGKADLSGVSGVIKTRFIE